LVFDRINQEAFVSGKSLGVLLAVLGLGLLAVSLLADRLGVGAMPGVIGWKQILGAGIGVLLMAGGVFLARRRSPSG
jgi:Na+/H+ antiporter NhaA